MPLLIDGHNLIGQMPDIDLADPDEESKLVHRLKRYCRQHNRRATVVFDAGLPGGKLMGRSHPTRERWPRADRMRRASS